MRTILSIDGGGVRGILPAIMLGELQRRTDRPLAELFDLIVGTSTGGILALFLASGKPVSLAVDLYRCEAANIFQRPILRHLFDWAGLWRPRYAADGVEAVLKRHFGESQLGSCRPVAVTTAQVANMSSEVLRSWDWPTLQIWQAGRATSAAPTYFPPTAEGFIDGGVWANNPSVVSMFLARELWPGEPYRLLSLGCGKRNRYALARKSQKWGLLHLAPRLPDMLMGAGEDFAEEVGRSVLGLNYLRIQTDLEAVDCAMDRCDAVHLQDLVHLGNRAAHEHAAGVLKFMKGAAA